MNYVCCLEEQSLFHFDISETAYIIFRFYSSSVTEPLFKFWMGPEPTLHNFLRDLIALFNRSFSRTDSDQSIAPVPSSAPAAYIKLSVHGKSGISVSFWPARVDISDLSTWVDGSDLSNQWEVAWIYSGRVKIFVLSTWINLSDLSNLWPIYKLRAECMAGTAFLCGALHLWDIAFGEASPLPWCYLSSIQ